MKLLATKSARRRFTVGRDIHGVPHISAGTWREALYGLGYMHAIDRPTQMLFSRAVASGQSAELIADKPELLEMDRFFRRVGLGGNLDLEVSQLDDETFDQLTAYCEGVNDGMKDSGRSLPMWAVGFVPQPWNQRSVLLMGNLLAFGGLVVGQLQNERILLELIQAGVAPDKLRELFQPVLDDADFDLLKQIQIASQMSDEALELIADLPRLAGSNAWAVSPQRSATGSALLACDPHLEINRLPAIWYEAELHWGHNGDQRYVLGATLPGCPLFAVARTPRRGLGRDVPERGHGRSFHRRLPHRPGRNAGSIAAATSGTTFECATSWWDARGARRTRCACTSTSRARWTRTCSRARTVTTCRPPGAATRRAWGRASAPGST